MRKTISILLMAMFIIGLLPAAFAEQESPIRTRYQVQIVSGNATDTNQTAVRARIQNATQTAIQRFQTARERYQAAKERYQAAKQRYQETKQRIQTAKTALGACRDSESEQCVNFKKQVRAHSGELLDNIADRVLATLDKIRSKVESNEDLTEEEAQDILARIDAEIQKVTDAKNTIQNLDNESTAEEIREAARIIKEAWTKTRAVLKRSVGRLIGAKIGGIIVRAEQLSTKLSRITDRLQDTEISPSDLDGLMQQFKEASISNLDDLVEQFNIKIQEAKENWEKAKEKYSEAVTPGEVDELMKEVNQYLRAAHQNLKEAHEILKEFFRLLKQKKGAQEAIAAAEREQSPLDVEADNKKLECLDDMDCKEWEYCNEFGECILKEDYNATGNETE